LSVFFFFFFAENREIVLSSSGHIFFRPRAVSLLGNFHRRKAARKLLVSDISAAGVPSLLFGFSVFWHAICKSL